MIYFYNIKYKPNPISLSVLWDDTGFFRHIRQSFKKEEYNESK